MSEKRYYMACLDLAGRSCLVVGGGSGGLEKARGLVDCDAQVTVVAPEVEPELRGLPVELVERRFESRDLDDRFLVVAATSDPKLNRRIYEEAEELLELGLQTGRVRALYGPGGEQATLRVYRQLPRGKQAGEAAREVTQALASLEGATLESIGIQAVGPAAFVLSLNAGGAELSVRLDRQGARLTSVGI